MKQIHIFTVFITPEAFFDGQFKYLADQGEEIILVSSFNKRAVAFAERNSIRFVPIEMPRAMVPGAIVKAIRTIIQLIRQEKPDAIFGHTPVGALCAMIAAKWCSVKNRVYYRHGVIYTTMKGMKREIFRLEEKFVASLATSIVNVSHSLSRLAVKDNLNADKKQFTIGHGTCGGIDAQNIFNPALIDEQNKAEKAKELGIENADIVFGFCGRICVDKGVPEMVEGFMKLRELHPELKANLLLIGVMDERDILPQAVKNAISNCKDIVTTGWVNKVDIPYFYSLLDVFVFPSHREGFGMCAIEASAMAKPLLVSHAHGVEDTIVEHETGEYIGLNAESICQGMEKMMDGDFRELMGKAGRKMVLDWYDSRVMWPQVLDLYKQILK